MSSDVSGAAHIESPHGVCRQSCPYVNSAPTVRTAAGPSGNGCGSRSGPTRCSHVRAAVISPSLTTSSPCCAPWLPHAPSSTATTTSRTGRRHAAAARPSRRRRGAPGAMGGPKGRGPFSRRRRAPSGVAAYDARWVDRPHSWGRRGRAGTVSRDPGSRPNDSRLASTQPHTGVCITRYSTAITVHATTTDAIRLQGRRGGRLEGLHIFQRSQAAFRQRRPAAGGSRPRRVGLAAVRLALQQMHRLLHRGAQRGNRVRDVVQRLFAVGRHWRRIVPDGIGEVGQRTSSRQTSAAPHATYGRARGATAGQTRAAARPL